MRKTPASGPDLAPQRVADILFVVSPRSVVPRQADQSMLHGPAISRISKPKPAQETARLAEAGPAIDYWLNSHIIVIIIVDQQPLPDAIFQPGQIQSPVL
jgi:hypothetical protein